MSMAESGSDPFNSGSIGFGCAYIMGGFEKKRNIKLLLSAFDCDIKYFDTAPMYGQGTSEEVVGEAFASNRHRISIATKVGIPHSTYTRKAEFLRAIATPIRRYLPKVSRGAATVLYKAGPSRPSPRNLTPLAVVRSVEDSLIRLRTDYVDLLLLHDAMLHEVTPELIDGISRMKSAGKVLRLGVASSVSDIDEIDRIYPNVFDVYQRAWSVMESDEDLFNNKIRIFHRSIMHSLEKLRRKMDDDRAFALRMRGATGLELTTTDEIAKVLIGAAVSVNPHGVTLFGTRRADRVANYAKAILSGPYVARGRALLAAYRHGP
jgi:aryl-alcohol dehydrogenase-like predicted oxidoreductase